MTLLDRPRQPPGPRPVTRDERPIAATTTGFYGPCTGDPTEVIVGHFAESFVNLGANGALRALVTFPRERILHFLENSGGNPLVAAGRERPCSIEDDHTVQAFTPGISIGGTFYDFAPHGVWVELPAASAGGSGEVGGYTAVTRLTGGQTRLIVTPDEFVRCVPGGGTATARAPASPAAGLGWRAAVKLVGAGTARFDGNGHNVEDPLSAGTYVAIASFTVPGEEFGWVWDPVGTRWDLGGA